MNTRVKNFAIWIFVIAFALVIGGCNQAEPPTTTSPTLTLSPGPSEGVTGKQTEVARSVEQTVTAQQTETVPPESRLHVLDFDDCRTEYWTDTQGNEWYHVNVSQPPNPFILWEYKEGSPQLTKSGTFNNPADANASEDCEREEEGKVLAVDYDVTTPNSFSGLFIQLNKENADFQPLLSEAEKYALRLHLKGDSGKVKIELKLPGVGWFYIDKPINQTEWREFTIPVDDFSLQDTWPSKEPMEFVIALENSALGEQQRKGTVYLDDVSFVPLESVSPTQENGKKWLDMEDPQGDDNGPGGYVYPTNSLFQQGSFDISHFKVLENENNLLFQFTMSNQIMNPWDAPRGISIQAFDIYLDTEPGGYTDLVFDQTIPENVEENPKGTLNAILAPENGWEFALRCQGWEAAVFSSPTGLEGEKQANMSNLHVDPINGIVTCLVAKDLIGQPNETWKIAAFSFGIDWSNARVVDENPSEWHFGGGVNDKSDPNIIDIIVPQDETQQEVLDFKDHSPVILPMISLSH